MTNEFIREDRYIVFKMPDLGNSLKGDEIRRLAREYAEHLEQLVKKPLDYVVVGAGWSEYGPALRAIEVHVTGAQPAPTIAEQEQINAEAAIRSIYGARPNDEALWQTIVNGMITPAHVAQAVADGTIASAYIMQPAPSINEGVRKVTLGFRWESEAQHHIPTIEIEFDPVSPDLPNDAKGWQDRDRLASMLTPEAKP